MRTLINEIILKTTEERPLTDIDLAVLTNKRNKQLKFLPSAYIPLSVVLLYMTINGINEIQRQGGNEFSEEEIETYYLVAPYVYGFLFVLLTIFFIHYYLQSLAPLVKDVKEKKKKLLYFVPEKTEMALFGRYYLSTPIIKKQQVEIGKEDFYAIPTGSLLTLEMAPHSKTILRFTSNSREIAVH